MKILILDYKCGNIGCIKNIFSFIGTDVSFKNISLFEEIDPNEFDIIVLPGVGNFQHASKYLNENLNIDRFKNWLFCNKKIISICLGFQLLFIESEESEKTNKGIGIIPAKITSLSNTDKLSLNIGWSNSKYISKNNLSQNLKSTLDNHYFYHMHSYGFEYKNLEDQNIFDWYTLSEHLHSNKKYISSFKYKHFYGFQFHPEKSGENGLKLLKTIINDDS
mgnify:CR=1 FL=1